MSTTTDPNGNEILSIKSMDPLKKSPEQLKKYKELEKKFEETYGKNLDEIFAELFPNTVGKIDGDFQNNGGNFEKALETEIMEFPLDYHDKKDLEWLIRLYLEKKEIGGGKEINKKDIETKKLLLKNEHPFVPILERFLEMGVLNLKEVNDVIQNLNSYNDTDIGSNTNAIYAIENSSELSQEKKSNLVKVNNQLINEEKENEEKIKRGEDIDIPEDISNISAFQNGENDDIKNLIGIHYRPILNKDKESNTKKDINTAIKKAGNDIVYGKVFNRDTITYKNNMAIIKGNRSVEQKVQALCNLQKHVNGNQGKKGSTNQKQNERFRNIDWMKELSAEEMQIRIQALLKKASENDEKKIEEMSDKLSEIKKEEKSSGGEVDALSGGKEDTLNDKNIGKEIA